jgi:ankyrin repeat protein
MARRPAEYARPLVLIALLHLVGTGAGAQSEMTLAEAVMRRDAAAVQSLLRQGADVNAFGRDGTPALHWAVRADDLQTSRLLLEAGADATKANRYGVTPLFLACANGNTTLMALLLDAGADANSSDPTGETALMTLCARRVTRSWIPWASRWRISIW